MTGPMPWIEVCVVFFDVKKVFDSVLHAPLLEKLAEIGLNPYIAHWIQATSPIENSLWLWMDHYQNDYKYYL